jgi:2,3-bisphosphoglycerate-dependent phosphoglycerate mutase
VTELLLVRHGRPTSGGFDPWLNDEGLEQAQRLARSLADEQLTAVISSDLHRAQQTAAIVAEAAGVPHLPLDYPGLREWGMEANSMEYIALEMLDDDHPQVTALAQGRFMDFVPDRVDLDAFRHKVADAFDKVLAEYTDGRIAVVCHGGVINAYIGQLVGIPDIFWFHPDYTSVSRVVRLPGGRVVIRSLNEVHHLLVESG